MRDYLLHLVEERKLKPSTYNVHAASLRFLYARTLEREAWLVSSVRATSADGADVTP